MTPAAPRPAAELAEEARALFAQSFAGAPDVVAAAPGRVNVIGEHLDYNGGRCLPVALEHTTVAALRPRRDGRVRLVSAQVPEPWSGGLAQAGPGRVTGWAAYAVGPLWALSEAGHAVPGADVAVTSAVPPGAGLSSSAALECAVGLAMLQTLGVPDDEESRRRLVDACVRAENEVAGAPTGGMDQTASVLAREAHALLVDFADTSVAHVPWTLEGSHTLLVVDTGLAHALAEGGYADRRAQCERAADALGVASLSEAADRADPDEPLAVLDRIPDEVLRRRARHVLTESARVPAAVEALHAGDATALGRLLDASHASLRDDLEVSCAELDLAVETARAHGALGARLTGAGFGGSAIALVPRDRVEKVTGALSRAFEDTGLVAPVFHRARPSAGARALP